MILHELGHSLGLDHSCDTSGGSDGFIGCSELPSDHEYRFAVMFPGLKARVAVVDPDSGTVNFAPETRETLTSNDADRASCLYLFDKDGGAFRTTIDPNTDN